MVTHCCPVVASHATNATVYEKLPFNFMRDIAPVAGIMLTPNVMEVNPSLPAIREFIAYATANPGKISFASAGVATSHHVCRLVQDDGQVERSDWLAVEFTQHSGDEMFRAGGGCAQE